MTTTTTTTTADPIVYRELSQAVVAIRDARRCLDKAAHALDDAHAPREADHVRTSGMVLLREGEILIERRNQL